jgi:hypothetical protein
MFEEGVQELQEFRRGRLSGVIERGSAPQLGSVHIPSGLRNISKMVL